MNCPEQNSAVNEPGEITAERPNIAAVRICLPIPHASLWPNARPHWATKARATRDYRGWAWAEALAEMRKSGMDSKPPWTSACCQATFFFEYRRVRDRDNCLAALKSAFDGLADAGVIANDAGLIHLPVVFDVDPLRPRVELLIVPN